MKTDLTRCRSSFYPKFESVTARPLREFPKLGGAAPVPHACTTPPRGGPGPGRPLTLNAPRPCPCRAVRLCAHKVQGSSCPRKTVVCKRSPRHSVSIRCFVSFCFSRHESQFIFILVVILCEVSYRIPSQGYKGTEKSELITLLPVLD